MDKIWLTPAERGHVEDLVREVMTTAYYDDAGVISQYLVDKTKIVAEIFAMAIDEKGEDIEVEDE